MGYFRPFLVFAACSALGLAGNVLAQQNVRPTEHLGKGQSLIGEDGRTRLEVSEVKYWTDGRGLVSTYCQVRNTSDKVITAVGMRSFTQFANGATGPAFDHLLFYFVHQDQRLLFGSGEFEPNQTREVHYPEFRLELGDAIPVTNEIFKVVFVEFQDGSVAGDKKSTLYQELLRQRSGAQIYKQWLESSFSADRDLYGIAQKVQSEELPEDSRLNNNDTRTGATMYRSQLRFQLQKLGLGALQKIF